MEAMGQRQCLSSRSSKVKGRGWLGIFMLRIASYLSISAGERTLAPFALFRSQRICRCSAVLTTAFCNCACRALHTLRGLPFMRGC